MQLEVVLQIHLLDGEVHRAISENYFPCSQTEPSCSSNILARSSNIGHLLCLCEKCYVVLYALNYVQLERETRLNCNEKAIA